MLELIFLAILSAACSGQPYRDFGYHDKPILRMATDLPNDPIYLPPEPTTEEPKEPEWVSNLRSNIQAAVAYHGFHRAKDSIKQLINEADRKVNGPKSDNKAQDTVSALRSFTDGAFYNKAEISYMNKMKNPSLRTKWEPRWETDLRNYIKGLIALHGKSRLDDVVVPVVSAIEANNNVMIKDIDGEVIVNWKQANAGPSNGFEEEPRLKYIQD